MPLHLPRLSITLGVIFLLSSSAWGQLGLLGRLRPWDPSQPLPSQIGSTPPSNDGLPTSQSRLRMTPPASKSALGELAAAQQPSGINLATTAAAPDSPLEQGLRDSSVFQGNPAGSALPGTTNSPVLRDGLVGDCAEPSRVNLDIGLAEKADIVITGKQLDAAAVPGHTCCSCCARSHFAARRKLRTWSTSIVHTVHSCPLSACPAGSRWPRHLCHGSF